MEKNGTLKNKKSGILFVILLSFILYLWGFLFTDITIIISNISSNISRAMWLSIIDFALISCFTILFTAINKKILYVFIPLLFIFYSVNYWVISLTNNRFQLSDINLIGAAMNNLTEVHISISQVLYFIVLIAVFILTMLFVVKKIEGINTNLINKIVIVFGCVFLCFYIRSNHTVRYWVENQKYIHSSVLYNISTFSHLGKPDNYDDNIKTIEAMKENFIEKDKNEKATPVIIQIMSEALADFDNIDYMPFTRTIKSGNVKTNIWGNKTVVSELESLTGISTEMLNTDGSTLYMSKLHNNMESTVNLLKNRGYKTIGIHPYSAMSYQRSEKWEKLNFDEMYFSTEIENIETVRDYVSDKTFFNNIIELIHSNEDIPVYIYGISMQNHAGYRNENFTSTVDLGSDELNQYISLQNITDTAFKEFIEQLKKEDREVILIYYGDHQPMLGDNIYQNILGDIDKYQTPYVLWSNKKELKDYNDIKMSDIPSVILDAANVPMDAYFDMIYKRLTNDKDAVDDSICKSWYYNQIVNTKNDSD